MNKYIDPVGNRWKESYKYGMREGMEEDCEIGLQLEVISKN